MFHLETTEKSPSPVPSIPESISEEELGDEIVIKEQEKMKTDAQKSGDAKEGSQSSKKISAGEVMTSICSLHGMIQPLLRLKQAKILSVDGIRFYDVYFKASLHGLYSTRHIRSC